MRLKKAIFLMGPTAAGKTKLAIELATKYPVDLISVDSAMIYQGMDIGTGKPSTAELKLAPHALIDILDPKDSYSAADFCKDALYHMQQSQARQRIPVLVGGTMLYFKALQFGLSDLPSQNSNIRANILKEASQYGWQYLHDKLINLDKPTATRIHPNDKQRIQRALEIIYITGKPMSASLNRNMSLIADWEIKIFALAPKSREELHNNIAIRFKNMLKQGLIEEVEMLFKRGDLHANLPAMRAVGYKQVWEYLANKNSIEDMQDKAIAATRQLAKRQLTWLRSWENINLLYTEDLHKTLPDLYNFLSIN